MLQITNMFKLYKSHPKYFKHILLRMTSTRPTVSLNMESPFTVKLMFEFEGKAGNITMTNMLKSYMFVYLLTPVNKWEKKKVII